MKTNVTYSLTGIGVLLLLSLLLGGCGGTKYMPYPVKSVEYRDRVIKDSSGIKEKVVVKDSIIRRDSTIFVVDGSGKVIKEKYYTILEKYKDSKYELEKLQSKYDSLFKIKRDSVPYPIEIVKTVTVEKKLTWWQTMFIWSGAIAWTALIIVLFVKLNKRTNWFFRLLNLLRKL